MEKSIPKKDIWQLWEWKKYFLSYCTVYGSTSQLSSRIYIVWQQSRYGKDILISIFILETSSLACISYWPLFPKHGTVYLNTWILRHEQLNNSYFFCAYCTSAAVKALCYTHSDLSNTTKNTECHCCLLVYRLLHVHWWVSVCWWGMIWQHHWWQ